MGYPQTSALRKPEVTDNTGPLPPGTRLDEFEIERVLCVSGFGAVYLAKDHTLDLEVALKEYLPSTLAVRGSSEQVELRDPAHGDAFERGRLAFISEARTLARCDHSSLLRVHRILEANGTVYRVMPCYAGESLLAVRQAMQEPPDEAALRALLDALLGALETLHNAGQTHGEVLPENILLLPDDRPVLMGFGAVRRAIVSDRTRSLMAALEPSRAAHGAESADEPQGPWTDLRALAAVAQFCISGVLVSPARSAQASLERVASQRYSKSLLDALDAMRAVQRDDALHTAAQFRELLKAPPANDSGRVEPVLNPAPPAPAAASGSPEPEPPQVNREVDLSQAVAVAMRQAKNLHAAAAPRAPRSVPAAQARFRPRPARVWSWGGAAVLALVFGAAGWKLSEQVAASTTAAKLAPAAGQSTVVAAAPADAPPSPSLEDLVARAPTSAGSPREAADEARTPAAGRDVATTAVVATAVAPSERVAESGRAAAETQAPTARPVVRAAGSPREECGARTNFALYRCMQMQCSQPRWTTHAQCARLRATDEVE